MTRAEIDEKRHFVTDTTDIAAYLIALGAETPTLDRSDPKRINYIFELTDEQYEAVPHFRDGTGMVRALAMSHSKKMLMGLIKRGNE